MTKKPDACYCRVMLAVLPEDRPIYKWYERLLRELENNYHQTKLEV